MFKKIGLFILSVVAIAIVALIVFISTFDVKKHLPQITGQIEKSLGRKVTIDNAALRLSLIRGLAVDIQGISILEDAEFGDGSFVHVEGIHCGVDTMALILKRQIAVTSIQIRSPQITIIKDKDGKFNYESLLKAAQQSQSSSTASPQHNEPPKAAPQNMSLPSLLVNSFDLSGASFLYIDRGFEPALEAAAKDISAQVTGFSLVNPFKLNFSAAVMGNEPNILAQGTGRLDLQLQQFRFDDFRLEVDLSKVDVGQLNTNIPSLASTGLQPGLNGRLQIDINQAVFGNSGILVLSVDGSFSDGRIVLSTLASPIENVSAAFDATELKLNLKEFNAQIATGSIKGRGEVNDYVTSQKFEGDVQVLQLPLGNVLNQKDAPIQLNGFLSGNIKIKGEGFSPEALNTLTGTGEFSIQDGELVNFNIMKAVLDKITIFPGLSQMLQSSLPEKWQKILGGSSTPIDEAQGKARIEQSKIQLDEMQIKAKDFIFTSQGSVGFDQTLDLQANLMFSEELSLSMIDSVKEMGALKDENNQIRIPVNVTGVATKPAVVPDVSYLSQRLLVNEGGAQIQKALEKNPEVKKFLNIFMGKDEGGEDQQDGEETPEPESPKASEDNKSNSGKKLLEGLFKSGF